ncbi:MAG: hypothetical protein C0393_05120 [Anaerolinea sp.]|nr:hypothetical protein [Anaerolinea sp.]
MKQQTIIVGPAPEVTLQTLPGDLRVTGWERAEMMAKTDGDMLNITTDGERISVSCDENLILYLPRQASLQIENVAGDACLQALGGAVTLGPVAGDISLNNIGAATLSTVAGDASLNSVGGLVADQIGGDFALRGGRGDCLIANIGGDASLRDVDGMVSIENVGSDLFLRNARRGVVVSSGADATLYLEPLPGKEYHITAGDDLLLRLPLDADVELHLATTSGSPEAIRVDFPGLELDEESPTQTITLGNGAARMFLTAGDELIVTSKADRWASAADFGIGMSDTSEWGIPGIPPIPPVPPIPPIMADLSERINSRVQAAMERAQARSEAASRRAEVKIAVAMRHAESKAHAAEARARRPHGRFEGRVVIGGAEVFKFSGQKPPERGEPVSDEERLTILKMLQEKKISLEEAEKLLAALEGK